MQNILKSEVQSDYYKEVYNPYKLTKATSVVHVQCHNFSTKKHFNNHGQDDDIVSSLLFVQEPPPRLESEGEE